MGPRRRAWQREKALLAEPNLNVCVCVGGISEVSSKQDFVPLPPSFPLSLSLRIGNIKIVVYDYNKLEA